MAITRKLNEIQIIFDAAGNPSVRTTAIVTDDVEETTAGWNKNWQAPRVLAAAVEMRDAVMEQSAGQGRSLTF